MSFLQNIRLGNPTPMGVSLVDGGINIAVALNKESFREFGIVFYENGKEVLRLAFPQSCRIGNMFAVRMDGEVSSNISYMFYCDGQLIMDPYAKLIHGRERWGDTERDEQKIRAGILARCDEKDWLCDRPLQIPYEKSIFYSLHVRGFTKHSSSQVSHKGTFEGITEKIDYLKELGITGVIAMPIYDFNEVIVNSAYQEIDPILSPYYSECKDVWQYRINYWGYSELGNYYFAPKYSYSAKKDPASSLKQLITLLHKNGIEMILQMYFSPSLAPDFVRDVLRYWVLEYHVDGFQLMGAKLPMELLGKDPLLGRTKLIAENSFACEIYEDSKSLPYYRNLACYQDGFRYDSRKFLKGDSDLVYIMSEHMRRNSECEGVINHITDYRGFTLMDLVSYDRKHNEENGENNRDGSDYNYSWNCGVEGPSKKKSINQLRLSQRKNAMAMLLLAQGTPLILSGDECGHTALGNNNAYCQDNKTNYINWKRNQTEEEFFCFVKELIRYRKEHSILHCTKKMRMTDSLSCGYPDLSYHGEQAWKAQFENYNHHLGMMYCSYYANEDSLPGRPVTKGDFIYLAFNMHWIEHSFSLPLLPNGYQWEVSLCSKDELQLDGDSADQYNLENTKNDKKKDKNKENSKELGNEERELLTENSKDAKKESRSRMEKVLLPPRSIAVLTGKKR